MRHRDHKPPYPCGWCSNGNHWLCHGDVHMPNGSISHCACADSLHTPDMKLARRMAVYARPDLAESGGVLLEEYAEREIAIASNYREAQAAISEN